MSILTGRNGFKCLDCGSDRLGMVCGPCGVMVCVCKGHACIDAEAERERDEKEAILAKREQMMDDVRNGFYD